MTQNLNQVFGTEEQFINDMYFQGHLTSDEYLEALSCLALLQEDKHWLNI